MAKSPRKDGWPNPELRVPPDPPTDPEPPPVVFTSPTGVEFYSGGFPLFAVENLTFAPPPGAMVDFEGSVHVVLSYRYAYDGGRMRLRAMTCPAGNVPATTTGEGDIVPAYPSPAGS